MYSGKKKEYYGGINGLRTIACIGIMMMHMAENNSYNISGFIYNTIVPSFTNFVFLFMTVSAFGMCCGYYSRMLNNEISLNDFYSKRFNKTLPFFAILVLADIIVSPSLKSLFEGFADITLLFGFLPNAGNITVIGVGWFLGLVFVFYLCFPFFCVLLQNKKRAWFSFAVSLIFNFVCSYYFGVGRTNILYSSCYFLAGGIIFLYREEIKRLNLKIVLLFLFGSVCLYYFYAANTMTCLAISCLMLFFAIVASKNSGGGLQKVIK